MKTLIIYFDSNKKNFQIVKPSEKFQGDYGGLVQGLTGGKFHSWDIH